MIKKMTHLVLSKSLAADFELNTVEHRKMTSLWGRNEINQTGLETPAICGFWNNGAANSQNRISPLRHLLVSLRSLGTNMQSNA